MISVCQGCMICDCQNTNTEVDVFVLLDLFFLSNSALTPAINFH